MSVFQLGRSATRSRGHSVGKLVQRFESAAPGTAKIRWGHRGRWAGRPEKLLRSTEGDVMDPKTGCTRLNFCWHDCFIDGPIFLGFFVSLMIRHTTQTGRNQRAIHWPSFLLDGGESGPECRHWWNWCRTQEHQCWLYHTTRCVYIEEDQEDPLWVGRAMHHRRGL